MPERLPHSCKIKLAELLPIGEHEQSMRILAGFVCRRGVCDAASEHGLRSFYCRRIERHNFSTFPAKLLDDCDRRRLAYVIGSTFECQSECGDPFPSQRPQRGANFSDEAGLLLFVHLDYFIK